MIVSIPLQPDTLLANVRYKFIVGTVEGLELSANVTQPDPDFAVFLFDVSIPDNLTEIVAYDVTDVGNWNVAGMGNLLSASSPATPAPIDTTRLVAMSTPFRMSFRRVFNGVLRLHGLDPRKPKSEDIAASLVEHINARVESICLGWPWPEWSATEERAFRQVWAAGRQFYRVNELGVPDEVFYIPTFSYWKVNPAAAADPTVGVPPSSDFSSSSEPPWIALDPVDTYVAYNQVCKRTIGQMLGVYSTDPRAGCGCSSPLWYRPSEKGIDVRCHGRTTVFIHYMQPTPEFTMTPFIAGRTYVRGDVIFDMGTGECFQAIDTTTDPPADDLTMWRHVPFLQKWYNYVRWGAYSDSLGEIDQGKTFDPNEMFAKAQNAEAKAMQALQQQVDSLTMQGQRLTYNFKRRGAYCETLPWSGGTVTTLTDECESSTGWIFPVPPSPIGIHWEWHPEIVSLRTTLPSLAAFPTLTWAPYSKIEIAIDPGTGLENMEWRLRSGPADVDDLNGKVAPLDYDAALNNKHWELIGA